MVFHSRSAKTSKKKIDLAKFKPYLLNAGIVLFVGIYVYAGALLIQYIERIPVKVEESFRLRRNSQDDMPIIPLDRSKECVLQALRKMSQISKGNCSQLHNNVNLLENCYASDLQKLKTIYDSSEGSKAPEQQSAVALKKFVIVDGFEQWTTTDAILFCFTVITTIGYGNVAPQSFWGRVFVIIYGTIGIPTAMMAIANVGKFLATLLKSWTRPFLLLCRKMKKRMQKKDQNGNEIKETQRLMESSKKKAKKIEDDISSHEDEEAEEEVEESDVTETIVLFVAFLVYIIAGSLLMSYYEEGMTFGLAIYFNFVTLTTIGLGDLVPQSTDWLFVTLVYCAIGLALTTIAIEIAADTLKKLHYFGRKLDNVQNVQIWFGGQKLSMKALVKNLGDQLNVPVEELENLDLAKFVDDAIKVEAGELTTLRNDRAWMNSNYWRAIESGSMHYVDDDDLVTLQSNLSCGSQQMLIRVPYSRSTDSRMITVNHEPLTETSDENFKLHSVNEEYETEQFPDIEAEIIDKPEVSQNEGIRKSSQCIELQKLLKALNDLNNEVVSQDGRWSEEARRRYLEYQRIWSRFRTPKHQ
ncbi:Potassium channel domain-containing protein [Caenorhabditis elegans]|uniref:Potassium channel domain-containing protein n=1 Tax=Caenorhabditis elegans TaxID=6239 RepID=K8ERV0_CAEEL|nr:Potassium channel domain-containing protein [Caenorhabditis elegans]CCO25643.1 Potassium channel domain-containing protein [Caenorhabditis elegans]|eukprot:NP_001263876.1 TWiK family of potassium channels [Caenorhabditis elegans]